MQIHKIRPKQLIALFAIISTLLLMLMIMSGCGVSSATTPNANDKRVVIQNLGSDTMVNLAQAWAEEYATVDSVVSVEVSGGGSGTGVAGLINGTADIANCSRQMEQDEIDKVTALSGQPPRMHIVGYDALAIFVNPDNPLNEITIDQLAEIYGENGRVRYWTDLGVQIPGCSSNEMILVSRQSNSGTYHYFREAIIGKGRDFRLGTLDLHGSKDVVELVARTPCALGYSGMGYATSHVKMLKVSRKPGQQAYAPSVNNTQAGLYPISRPLYMYTKGEVSDAIGKYIDWIRSDDAQKIVLTSGYVPNTRDNITSLTVD